MDSENDQEEIMPGTLYICATPIGNLDDITIRVLNTLKTVDLIAAEDTRNTLCLLNHFDIKTPLTSYHEYNKIDKADFLVEKLTDGTNIALVTDAGTPAISDPGEELVRRAHAAGIPITSLPGACACITALTLSGLSTRRFCFEAFLPFDKKERKQILEMLKKETRTIILYESPHHIKATLKELFDALGNRKLTLCRELTKIHETVTLTTLEEALSFFEENAPRGEYVLVMEGISKEMLYAEEQKHWNSMSIPDHVNFYTEKGYTKKDAMKLAAKDRGISKRDIYQALL